MVTDLILFQNVKKLRTGRTNATAGRWTKSKMFTKFKSIKKMLFSKIPKLEDPFVQISDDQAGMKLVEIFKKKNCLPSINPAMEKVGLLVVCRVHKTGDT